MFSKGLFQPSNSKNCFIKMEFNFTKMREVCIPNNPIFKIILHFLHSSHRMGEFKRSSQIIFLEIYNFTIWVINFKGIFGGVGDEFGQTKTWVLLGTWKFTKTSFVFHMAITMRYIQEGLWNLLFSSPHTEMKGICCNCFYF